MAQWKNLVVILAVFVGLIAASAWALLIVGSYELWYVLEVLACVAGWHLGAELGKRA